MRISFGRVWSQGASRAGAAALTLAVQLLLIYFLIGSAVLTGEIGEDCACVFVTTPKIVYVDYATPPPPYKFVGPVHAVAQPPPIEIVGQAGKQILPPRPDPAFPNEAPPALSASAGAKASPLIVLVRALIEEDGKIGDAELAGSCGVAALDAYAVGFVKAHWRFLPATENGRPIARWSMLEVPLAPER